MPAIALSMYYHIKASRYSHVLTLVVIIHNFNISVDMEFRVKLHWGWGSAAALWACAGFYMCSHSENLVKAALWDSKKAGRNLRCFWNHLFSHDKHIHLCPFSQSKSHSHTQSQWSEQGHSVYPEGWQWQWEDNHEQKMQCVLICSSAHKMLSPLPKILKTAWCWAQKSRTWWIYIMSPCCSSWFRDHELK